MARDKPARAPTGATPRSRPSTVAADGHRAAGPGDGIPQPLTAAQARFLRGQAHDLKAILQIGGKGLTDTLLAEVDAALEHHELVKVRIAAEDRDARNVVIAALAEHCRAALVQRIGHVVVLYRESRDKRQIVLPRA